MKLQTGSDNRRNLPVGSVSVRTRYSCPGEVRAFVKVAEPSVWRLRARVVWEQANGPIPRGMHVHHKDRDKLNDAIDNLQLLTGSEHMAEHRHEYKEVALANSHAARRLRPIGVPYANWTVKPGPPTSWSEDDMQAAIADYRSGGGSYRTVAARHGVGYGALFNRDKGRVVQAVVSLPRPGQQPRRTEQ